MDTVKLEKSLKSIGKKSFVEDYNIYRDFNMTTNEKVVKLAEKYTASGAAIRVSFANDIFKDKKQEDALRIIIDSPRISENVKALARKYLFELRVQA
ncbi:hypothetical protein ACN6MY_03890 [Peribacillus sp. B-H-3]|uniref:hypothetical protein n=1 Tax=Peribacillus sp. B-H-3 TaxID=3400420 RepID=UPI003B02DEBC